MYVSLINFTKPCLERPGLSAHVQVNFIGLLPSTQCQILKLKKATSAKTCTAIYLSTIKFGGLAPNDVLADLNLAVRYNMTV